MTGLFLSPHNDDETLFGAYTVIREKPVVIVCLRSYAQDEVHGFQVTFAEREEETREATDILGAHAYWQWEFSDRDPDWDEMAVRLSNLRDDYDHCFAPADEENGHEHHSMIGCLADDVFGVDHVTHYMTYTNGRSRSEGSRRVGFENEWVGRKLRALACYESQIALTSTGHHFAQALTEWYE